MVLNIKSTTVKRLSAQAGYTLIELLAVIFVFLLARIGYGAVPKDCGIGIRLLAGFISGAAGCGLIVLFYRWSWRRDKARLAKLKADYAGIFKVLAVPGDDQPAIFLQGAEIRVGDFGWEALPLAEDGLVYLQGLTDDWLTVWHAGFRPDQIERMGAKPSSQYDHWVPYWVKTPPVPCPFPVQPRETPTMGRPHQGGRYFEAYPQPNSGKMVNVKRSVK